MSNVLAVFGATGQQGGSLINYVLNDPELSKKYQLRAITRDVSSEKAKLLKEKVEVVKGDVADRASLETALTGVHTVFAITTPDFGPDGFEIEYNSGKTIADVTVERGIEYIIFSTLPSISDISGGKYTKSIHFDAKAKVEQYIRSLSIKSAFYAPDFPPMNPQRASDSTWVLSRPTSPKTRAPFVDAIEDTGKFIGAILAEPDTYEGKTFCACTTLYSWEEIAAILSKATGKTVVNKEISPKEFAESLPFGGDIFVETFSYFAEFGGYYGPGSEEMVAWAIKNARGKLTTMEEYLERHPVELI
ncbi:uncharacterized protein KY384_007909 [Bacidia gigantensis]|uniref:uncharacterized protein n=1 Tax=Bacidia gigantensis TaxID=2732470 RepID=UPI001D037B00|nr:uncharacterized protein KY384_007909 [Bacidia gigantensis]KAG8527755.1 hypothetical protein KY384_007909 [Bacidia gigantensis]